MSQTHQLLITADDYGIFDPIDNGIERCIDKLDCIDILVTHHSAERRIKGLIRRHRARIESGDLKLGLHLNLTCGGPQYTGCKRYLRKISKVPKSGIREFRRNSVQTFIPYLNNLLRKVPDGLEAEIEAQYQTFKRITGREPFHVSSHEGVYSGHKDMYAMLKKFCVRRNIPMRCPTLINFITKDGFGPWRENEQLMLTDASIKLLALFEEGREVRRWILKSGENIFGDDLSTGTVISNNYFVEHFFKQGSYDHLVELMERMSDTPSDNPLSFEMVVHPVQIRKHSDYKNIPKGINKKEKVLNARTKETEALYFADLDHLRMRFDLGTNPF